MVVAIITEASGASLSLSLLPPERLKRSLLLLHGKTLWEKLDVLRSHRNEELSTLADEVRRAICALTGSQIARAVRSVTARCTNSSATTRHGSIRSSTRGAT